MSAEQVSAYRDALQALCNLRAARVPKSGLGWPYMQALRRAQAAFGCPPEATDHRQFSADMARREWFDNVWPRLHRSLFEMADRRGFPA